jgi:hypothetical protein
VAFGIEDRAHHPGDVLRPSAVGAGIEHQVGALGIQLAEDAVIELGGAQGFAAGEGKGAEIEAAGLGIAFNAKPKVAAAAATTISTLDLSAVLLLMGI